MKRIHQYLTLGLSAMLMMSAGALPASAAAVSPITEGGMIRLENCPSCDLSKLIDSCQNPDLSNLLPNCKDCDLSDLLKSCPDMNKSNLPGIFQMLCPDGSCLPFMSPNPSQSETSIPETSIPETSIPETSIPETSIPETSIPETSIPEPSIPETSIPEVSKPVNQSFHSSYESEVVDLVNVERAKAGLPALTADKGAAAVAQLRSKEIVTQFSHTRPDGRSCFTAASDRGISYRFAGENIAYGYATPEQVVTGWMNSEGHRRNILSADFTKIGVGCYESNGVRYWTQFFMG